MKLALLGSNIQRSRMPRLQEYLGKQAGIPVQYDLIDGKGIAGFNPVDEVQKAITAGYSGLNVTHPYKQQVRSLVNKTASPEQASIGSLNTLVFTEGEIFGANTDYTGFIRAYRQVRGNTPPGRVLLCGAGGVGRAIAFGLATLDCREIQIFDIDSARAEDLSNSLQQQGARVSTLQKDDIQEASLCSNGLVNCTAMGMHDHPGTSIDLSFINNQDWAMDAVYTPLHTSFLNYCRESGLQCLSGFDLWFFQGLDAFRTFTGHDIKANRNLIDTALCWVEDDTSLELVINSKTH